MLWLDIGLCSPLAALLGIISLTIIIYRPVLPLIWLFYFICVWFSCIRIIISLWRYQSNNTYCVVGTTIDFNNMAVVAGEGFIQLLIEVLLYYVNWRGAIMHNGALFYGIVDYEKAPLYCLYVKSLHFL